MDKAVISVTHQQYAIVSDGVVSLYDGDGTTMTTSSRGYLTVTPLIEYGPVELSIDVVFRELDESVPNGWTLESQGSFEAIAELRVETADGQVWTQFESLKEIQYPSDVLFRAYRQYRTEKQDERHLLELTPRLKLPIRKIDEGEHANEVGDDRSTVIGLYNFGE